MLMFVASSVLFFRLQASTTTSDCMLLSVYSWTQRVLHAALLDDVVVAITESNAVEVTFVRTSVNDCGCWRVVTVIVMVILSVVTTSRWRRIVRTWMRMMTTMKLTGI
jgi:hypothetical protein